MWNPQADRAYQSLRTNQSKYTCSFSDFPWPRAAPMFPTLKEVSDYLRGYRQQFLNSAEFRCGAVIKTIQSRQSANKANYEVTWTDTRSSDTFCEVFENVVICSGIFVKPVMPSVAGLSDLSCKVIHSAQYRRAEYYADKTVVVLGASFSSTEIAADLASVAKRVIAIMPRPLWVVPRFIPLVPNSPSTPFLPVDLVFYRVYMEREFSAWLRDSGKDQSQLSTEELEQLKCKHNAQAYHREEMMFRTPEKNLATNEYMRSVLQQNSFESVHIDNGIENKSLPPFVSICDNFDACARDGIVSVIPGRLAAVRELGRQATDSVTDSQAKSLQCTISRGEGETVIDLEEVDSIIACTGYCSGLDDYMHPTILDTIEFDKDNLFSQFVLHNEIVHPSLPGLYFVGMYGRPYFGIMELQAVSW